MAPKGKPSITVVCISQETKPKLSRQKIKWMLDVVDKYTLKDIFPTKIECQRTDAANEWR